MGFDDIDSPFGLKVCNECGKTKWIPKLLGTGTITEVFEIEMVAWKMEYPNEDLDVYQIKQGKYTFEFAIGLKGTIKEVEELAKLDGFKSGEGMFKYFNKNYDLSTPKRFAVYRWGWD